MNLADDLMEPFRLFVDGLVIESDLSPMSTAARKAIVRVLEADAAIDGDRTALANAVDMSVCSYVRALESRDASLILLPSIPRDSR